MNQFLCQKAEWNDGEGELCAPIKGNNVCITTFIRFVALFYHSQTEKLILNWKFCGWKAFGRRRATPYFPIRAIKSSIYAIFGQRVCVAMRDVDLLNMRTNEYSIGFVGDVPLCLHRTEYVLLITFPLEKWIIAKQIQTRKRKKRMSKK